MRVQHEDECVNSFITDLYAEFSIFGDLRVELICDRIVAGIRNKNLSERFQLESDLTPLKIKSKKKPLFHLNDFIVT